MCHERDDLVVGHSRRTDDPDDSGHGSRPVLRSDNREILEVGIAMLVPDADRDSGSVAPLAQQVAEMLPRLGERNELPHFVHRRELGLLGKQ